MNGYCLKVIRGIDIGKRYSLSEGAITIGRSEDNSLKFNENELLVSNHHAIFYNYPGNLYIQDLNSRNGLFLNGERSTFNEVFLNDVIGFGAKGPQLKLAFLNNEEIPDLTVKNNYIIPESKSAESITSSPSYTEENENSSKVLPKKNNRKKQSNLLINFYAAFLRSRYQLALISSIILFIFCISAFFEARFIQLKIKPDSSIISKNHFNTHDFRLNQSGPNNHNKLDSIIGMFTQQSDPSQSYSTPPLKPVKDTIENYLNKILSDLGQVDYQIPSQMISSVKNHLEIFSKSRKIAISNILRRKSLYFPMIQKIFSEKNIPPQLAYISMLESGLNPKALSHAGAMGLWQFMPHTARRYGLKIDTLRDERIEPEAATLAAAEYLQDLIGIFGGNSSIMLVMAAYNAGERRVMDALRKIEDPIRNRDFWYIYRMGFLSEETNEYIPRILALMIIDENREDFGFSTPQPQKAQMQIKKLNYAPD